MLENPVFAIHTATGGESEVQQLIRSLVPGLSDKDCFVPKRVFYFRRKHHWHKQVKELFPGYIFIRSAAPEQLFFALKEMPKFARLLAYDIKDNAFVPLSSAEADFLSLICRGGLAEIRKDAGGTTNFVIPGSRVEIISRRDVRPGDVIRPRGNKEQVLRIIDGPLLELNPYVSRIDFGNRSAILDCRLCGKHNIHIGIKLPKDNIVGE